MKGSAQKTLLLSFAVFTAVAMMALFLALRSGRQPLHPMPNPNGYHDFVKAAQSLEAMDYTLLRGEELKTVLSNEVAAISLAKTGLGRESRVPLEFKSVSPHLTNLAGLKRLAQAFVAEGRLAEFEKRPANAAQWYLDTMRLGQASTRGGLIIDGLVGIAIESLGLASLEKLAPQLDADVALKTAASLQEINLHRESAEEILQDERRWARLSFGLKGWFAAWLPSSRKTAQGFTARLNAQAKRTDGLVKALKLEGERGTAPTSS